MLLFTYVVDLLDDYFCFIFIASNVLYKCR